MYMKSFLSYLNQTADLLPDKLAFSDGEQGLTFRELRQAAANVGACLRHSGAKAEPVGVLMERGAPEIAAFLGVLEAGCFYVPLDEQHPVPSVHPHGPEEPDRGGGPVPGGGAFAVHRRGRLPRT